MLNRENLVVLAKQVARANPSAPVAYSFGGQDLSYEALNETLRAEFNEIAGTYQQFRENKNLVFSVMEEVINDIMPKRVAERYADFA
jgi:hypothetical protein